MNLQVIFGTGWGSQRRECLDAKMEVAGRKLWIRGRTGVTDSYAKDFVPFHDQAVTWSHGWRRFPPVVPLSVTEGIFIENRKRPKLGVFGELDNPGHAWLDTV